MKTTALLVSIFFSLGVGTDTGKDQTWRAFDQMDFRLSHADYDGNHIYFYHKLIEKPISDRDVQKFNSEMLPIDLFGYWEERGDEDYHILFSKTAYTLDEPVTFFNAEILGDTDYISRTMPDAVIEKNEDVYNISVGFGMPDIAFELMNYNHPQFSNQFPHLDQYFVQNDGLGMNPDFIAVQHNFDFGRVMFQKTSKMSVSISRYFAKSPNETIVINYTLNYIHNMPPKLFGGSQLLIDKIKEGIEALIRETQLYLLEKK